MTRHFGALKAVSSSPQLCQVARIGDKDLFSYSGVKFGFKFTAVIFAYCAKFIPGTQHRNVPLFRAILALENSP